MRSIKHILLGGVSVMNLTGSPTVQYYEMAPLTIKKQSQINRNGLFNTGNNEFLNLKVNENIEVIMLEKSVLGVRGDADLKQTFKVQRLDIQHGKVYLGNKASLNKVVDEKPQKNMLVVTDFFQMEWKPERNYVWIIEKDKDKSSLTFCNAGEEMVLELYDHEEKKILKKNQSISFQGVKEDTGIAFDLLLQGRKAPKGSWGKITSCNSSEFDKHIQQILKKKKDEAKAKNTAKAKKLEEQKKIESQFDCLRPYGKINQCWYQRKGDHCIRRRCNAEGRWKDEIKLNKEECYQTETVRACAY